MEIRPLRTARDHDRALRKIEQLWDAPEGSKENDEMRVLVALVDSYEREHFPIDLPDPIEAIRFRLEQQGKQTSDLIGIIGGRTRVYEVLQRKRPLSLKMIRSLHDKLGIPADVLIQNIPSRSRRRRHGSARHQRASILRTSA